MTLPLLLLVSSISADPADTKPLPPPQFPPLRVDPAVTPGLLPNGSPFLVKECERKPEIFGSTLADAIGRPHKWFVVEDSTGRSVHAPGLGNKVGVPGAGGQSYPDWPLSKTYLRDHSNEIARSCRPLTNVDPYCVLGRTPYGRYEGRWFPLVNDCNTFASRTLDACKLNPWPVPFTQSVPPAFKLGIDYTRLDTRGGSEGLTTPYPQSRLSADGGSWTDRFSLFGPPTTAKYGLGVNTDLTSKLDTAKPALSPRSKK